MLWLAFAVNHQPYEEDHLGPSEDSSAEKEQDLLTATIVSQNHTKNPWPQKVHIINLQRAFMNQKENTDTPTVKTGNVNKPFKDIEIQMAKKDKRKVINLASNF